MATKMRDRKDILLNTGILVLQPKDRKTDGKLLSYLVTKIQSLSVAKLLRLYGDSCLIPERSKFAPVSI